MFINYNDEFSAQFEKLNNLTKGYGYKNCIDWADKCLLAKTMTKLQRDTVGFLYDLRVLLSHGYAKDISVTKKTLSQLKKYVELAQILKIDPKKIIDSKETKGNGYRHKSNNNYGRYNKW